MDLHGGHHWILGGHFRLFTNRNSLYSFAEPMFFQDGLVLLLICSSMSQNAKNDATHFMG